MKNPSQKADDLVEIRIMHPPITNFRQYLSNSRFWDKTWCEKKKFTDGSSIFPLIFVVSHETTTRHVADDGAVYSHRHDNLQSCIFSYDSLQSWYDWQSQARQKDDMINDIKPHQAVVWISRRRVHVGVMTVLPIPKELTILLQKLINHKKHSSTWEPYSSPPSIEPKGSLPYSQQHSTWLYHKPDQSSPCPPNRFIYATFWCYPPINA